MPNHAESSELARSCACLYTARNSVRNTRADANDSSRTFMRYSTAVGPLISSTRSWPHGIHSLQEKPLALCRTAHCPRTLDVLEEILVADVAHGESLFLQRRYGACLPRAKQVATITQRPCLRPSDACVDDGHFREASRRT